MQMRRSPVGLLLVLLLASLVLFQRAGAAARLCGAAHEAVDSEEAALLALINTYRAANAVPPLSLSPVLSSAAAWMAEDLAVNGYFSHTDSLGRSPYQRAVDCGYGSGAGENLAAGHSWSTAVSAFEAWRASPGHNANMLSSLYREIGIARYYRAGSPYGWYWVTSFGAGAQAPSHTPSPTPSPTPAPTPSPAPPRPPGPAPVLSPSPPALPPGPQAAPGEPAENQAVRLTLHRGLNLVSWPGPASAPGPVLGGYGTIRAVYAPLPGGGWLRYFPGLPAWLDTLERIEPGQPLWIIASRTTVVTIPAAR